jgi:hypothetical protein
MHEPSSVDLAEQAAAELRALYGDRLIGIFEAPCPLFGDDEERPDVQFIALLTGHIDTYAEIARISGPASELSLNHALFVSIYPVGDQDLRGDSGQTPVGLHPGDLHRVA